MNEVNINITILRPIQVFCPKPLSVEGYGIPRSLHSRYPWNGSIMKITEIETIVKRKSQMTSLTLNNYQFFGKTEGSPNVSSQQ